MAASALLLALVAPAVEPEAGAQTPVPQRPNLLVIMTDDQTVESLRHMPRLRRHLTSKGVRFTNSFVSYPLCCPSRATALTGQYSHNNGVRFNYAPRGGWQAFDGAADSALPVALQQAGYHTAHMGKVMNEYGMVDPTEVPPGWDTWHALIDRPARNRYYGFRVNVDGQPRTVPPTSGNYNTSYFARQATSYITSRRASPDPFFLNLWLFAPHAERGNGAVLPAEHDVGKYGRLRMPRPPSLHEKNMGDKPPHLRRKPLGTRRLREAQRRYRWRQESLIAVDEAVARITATLRRTGQLDNTVIVFTSDNGFFHGEHAIAKGKWHVYDEATRVPLIIRGPGVPKGVTRTAQVANVDLAPTLLQYARAPALNEPDGRPLQPLITGQLARFKRDLLLTTGYGRARRWYTAIRTPRYLYVEHVQNSEGTEVFAEELYDLRKDPWQLKSLHRNRDLRPLKNRLRTRLHQLRRCAGTSCHSRSQLPPPSSDTSHTVEADETNTAGPVDDPESHPEFFSIYEDSSDEDSPTRAEPADVTLRRPARTLKGTTTATFTARVTRAGAGVPDVTVTLRRQLLKTRPWTDMGVAVTDSTGRARFTQPVSAGAQWRAHVLPQAESSGGLSAKRTVRLAPRITAELARARGGRAMIFSGAVSPNRRGHAVQLWRYDGKRWVLDGRTRLTKSSSYEFKRRVKTLGRRYRVEMPATATTTAVRTRTLYPRR